MAGARTRSATLDGMRGRLVEIEVDVSPGLPKITLVGLPDASLSEARDRCRAAVINSQCSWPDRKVTINLSPTILPKMGVHYDLALGPEPPKRCPGTAVTARGLQAQEARMSNRTGRVIRSAPLQTVMIGLVLIVIAIVLTACGSGEPYDSWPDKGSATGAQVMCEGFVEDDLFSSDPDFKHTSTSGAEGVWDVRGTVVDAGDKYVFGCSMKVSDQGETWTLTQDMVLEQVL